MPFTQNTSPTFAKQPQHWFAQLTNPGTADLTVVTAGANGSKIIGLIIASTDTVSQNIAILTNNGTVDCPLGVKAVPASSGFAAGTVAVNMLDPNVIVGMPIDSDGNPFLTLASGETLTIKSTGTITSTKTITCHALGSDF